MSTINPANNSSNTHSWFTNLVPDITPSHAHSSASIVTLIASSIVLRHVIQIRGASRRQGYTLCNPGSPCTLRFIQILLSVHSTFSIPTCKYPFIDRYHLYNTVHYIKKSLCCYVQLALGIHTRICPLLILFVCSRPLACLAVHTLACSHHHHSFAAFFFHSFRVLTHCVYFLRVVLFGLSPVVCLCLIGSRQRDICSAVLVLRNFQITEYFVPGLN